MIRQMTWKRFFVAIFFIPIALVLSGCPGKLQGDVQFSKIPPMEVLLNSKVLFIPVNESVTIPVTKGNPPYTYKVLEGEATVDEKGSVTAPDFLTIGNIKITDSEDKTSIVPYVVVSKPLISVESTLVSPDAVVPMRVVGGVLPYKYSIMNGQGEISEDGIYSAKGNTGVVTLLVEDSIGSKASVMLNVQGGLTVTNPVQTIANGSTLNLSVENAVGDVVYQIVSGKGSINSSTGEFVAPSTNGTTVVRISDSLGNTTFKEITVTDGSNGPLTLYPATASLGAGQILKVSSSGGTGSKTFSKTANASDSLTGPGTLAITSDSATFTAPVDLTEVKVTTLQVTDAQSGTSTAVITIYPKPVGSVASLQMTVGKSAEFTISGGLAPLVVTADRGVVSVNNATVTYTAPVSEGTARIKIKDALGQESYVSVAVSSGLQSAPAKVSLAQGTWQNFIGVGGKTPYSYRLINKNNEVLSDEEAYGALTSEGVYTAPKQNSEVIVEVQDAEGSKALSYVTVYGDIEMSPTSGVVAANKSISFEIKGGSAPITVTQSENSLGGTLAEASAGVYQYTAPAVVSTPTQLTIKATDSQGKYVVVPLLVNPSLTVTLSGVVSDKLAIGNVGALQVTGGKPPYIMTATNQDKAEFTQSNDSVGEFSALAAGTFSVTVKDQDATEITKTITVVEKLAVSPSLAVVEAGAKQAFAIQNGVTPYASIKLLNGTGQLVCADSSIATECTGSSFSFKAGIEAGFSLVRVTDALQNSVDVQLQTRAVDVIATLSGQPTGVSNATTLNVTVAGTNVVKYKYALVDSVMPCDSNLVTYSAAAVVATPITGNIGADGSYRLCVIGINANDVEQPTQVATSVTWSKDTAAPTLSFTSPAANTWVNLQNQASFSVSGTAAEDLATLKLKNGTTELNQGAVVNGQWTVSLDLSSIADGNFTLTAELTDAGGNVGQTTLGLRKDTVAPSAPTALVDGTFTNSTTTSPNISFTAGTDGASGVAATKAKVILGNDDGVIIKDWFDITNNSTISGLNLLNETLYKVYFKTLDNAGNESTVAMSDGWTVDQTAPLAPTTLSDGTTNLSLTSSPALTWNAGSDTLSGIASYEIAIGTSVGGTQIKGWTNVGNVLTTTVASLTLSDGVTYYASVRAIDVVGNVSSEFSSDGWVAQNPICTFVVPATATWTAPANLTLNYTVVGGGGGRRGQGGGGGGGSSAIVVNGTASVVANGGNGGSNGQTLTGTLNVNAGNTINFYVGGGGGGGGGQNAYVTGDPGTGPGGGGGAGYKGGSGGGGGFYNSGGGDGVGGSTVNGTAVCSNCGGGGALPASSAGSGFNGGAGAQAAWGNGGFGGTSTAGGTVTGTAGTKDGGGGGAFGGGGGAGSLLNNYIGGVGGSAGMAGSVGGNTTRTDGKGSREAYFSTTNGIAGLAGADGGSGGNAGMIRITYQGAPCETPPTVPQNVDDGPGAISWTAPASSGSIGGLTYEVALGTTLGGTEIKGWHNIGNVLYWAYSGVSLSPGTTYYASVRAVDAIGNESPIVKGNGFSFQNCTAQVVSKVSWTMPFTTLINYTVIGGGGGYRGQGGGGGGGSSAIVVGGTPAVVGNGGNGSANGVTVTGNKVVVAGSVVDFYVGGGGGGGGGQNAYVTGDPGSGPGGGGGAGYKGGGGGGGGFYNAGGGDGTGGTTVNGAGVCSSCGGGNTPVSNPGSGFDGGNGASSWGNPGFGGTSLAGGAVTGTAGTKDGGGGGSFGGGGGAGSYLNAIKGGYGGGPGTSGSVGGNTTRTAGLGSREAIAASKAGLAGTAGANGGGGGNAGAITLSYRAESCMSGPSAPLNFNDGSSSEVISGSMTWSAPSDLGSFGGPVTYEIAIGTSAGATNTKTWFNVGSATALTYSGLGLTTNVVYYATIRAVDPFGNVSVVVQGDGFKIIP